MSNAEFLSWIWQRMVNHHGEQSNVDYMLRLNAIILEMKYMECATETPEEKEALDMIDTTSRQVESLANNSELPNGSEWKNGDECIWNGIECTFIGMSISHPSIAIVEYLKGLVSISDRVYVNELSKPESPEQKVERERLEAAYDLYCYAKKESVYYCVIVSFKEFIGGFSAREREEYLAIVDKTGYRKESK